MLLLQINAQDVITWNPGGYDFINIQAGNPLEMFMSSVPGIDHLAVKGYYHSEALNNYGLGIQEDYHSYFYLGVLSLPLTVVGLLYGRKPLRIYLFILLGFLFSIVCLSAVSPFMFFLFIEGSPLLSVNHISDSLYKMVGHLLIIFSAGLGLETLICKSGQYKSMTMFTFILSLLFSIICYVYYFGEGIFYNTRFGLLIQLNFMFGVLLYWYFNDSSIRMRKFIIYVLLVFVFVDVATFSMFHTRTIIENPKSFAPVEGPVKLKRGSFGIGLQEGIGATYGHILFRMRHHSEMMEMIRIADSVSFRFLPDEFIPETKVYYNAIIKSEKPLLEEKRLWMKRVEISQGTQDISKFMVFETASDDYVDFENLVNEVKIIEKTFNTVKIKVDTPKRGILFLKDGYSPYWKATVNDNMTPVARAFYNYKAIVVPEGKSIVYFQFSPPFIKQLLFIIYILFVSFGSISIWKILKSS